MIILKTTKYLIFRQIPSKTKTKVIEVVNIHHDEVIGMIKWYGPWRQYCFFPEFDTVWNTTCLIDVNEVIGTLMQDRKTKK